MSIRDSASPASDAGVSPEAAVHRLVQRPSARGRPFVLLVSIVLIAFQVAIPRVAQSAVEVLRLAWWTDAGFPTPFAASTIGPGGVVRLQLIYDTLTWKDSRGLIPWLATSWQVSPDGRTYTFTLQPGVLWQDGIALSADDVKFSFAYYRQHPFPWVSTARISRVEVRGARTVSITLADPFAPFLTDIAGVVPIIPAHIWRAVLDPVLAQEARVAVGSGPFRLAAYTPATGECLLRANAQYFKGPPVVREIRYQVLPTEQQLLAVQQGRLDAALTLDYAAAASFRGRAPLQVLETEPLSVVRLVFNTRRPPFNDRRFRQAIAYALPRRQIASLVTHGPALVGGPAVIPPGTAWSDPAAKQYSYNPERATTLLARIGVRRGGGIRVELLTDPTYPDPPLIQQALRRVGVDVAPVPADPKTRSALARQGKFQMLLTSHIGVGGDPDFLRRWFSGDPGNAFAAGDRFDNDEFQRLARQQLGMLDAAARRRIVFRMQEILAEEVPTLPLYYRRFYWIYNGGALHPFETKGGLLDGIPSIENKLVFLPHVPH